MCQTTHDVPHRLIQGKLEKDVRSFENTADSVEQGALIEVITSWNCHDNHSIYLGYCHKDLLYKLAVFCVIIKSGFLFQKAAKTLWDFAD